MAKGLTVYRRNATPAHSAHREHSIQRTRQLMRICLLHMKHFTSVIDMKDGHTFASTYATDAIQRHSHLMNVATSHVLQETLSPSPRESVYKREGHN